jgi:hypothetical protein
VSGGSRGQPDHQRSDDHHRPVVGRSLLIARCNAPPLLELVHAPLHHVAPAVGLAIELRRPTLAALALVLALGDDVCDAARTQQLPAARVAVPRSASRRSGRLRGRPRPGRTTRIASSTAPSWVLSWRCQGVTKTERGLPLAGAGEVQLGRQPPSAPPERLVLGV